MKNRFALLFLTLPLEAGDSVASLDLSDLDERSAKAVIAPPKAKGSWSLRGGLAARRLGKTSIDPGFASSGNFDANFFAPNPMAGPLGENADRTYDNGFVNLGAATAATGLTTHWGYQDDAQLVGDSLLYSLGGGTALDFPSTGTSDEDTRLSPFLELAYLRPFRKDLEIGFATNFFFTDLESRFQNPINQYSVTTTDRFSLNGIFAPQAPYAGTFNGPGPVLANQPDGRQFQQAQKGTQNYLFESDTRLFSFGLGTEALWHPTNRFHLALGTGVVANLADWSAESQLPLINPTTSALENRSFRGGDTELLMGWYLKVESGFALSDQWSATGFFRYDWTEDLKASAGPTDFEVDLSGWSIGLGATYSF